MLAGIRPDLEFSLPRGSNILTPGRSSPPVGQPFCSQQLPQLSPPWTDAAHRLKSRWDSRCSCLSWASKPSQRQFIIPLVFLGIVGLGRSSSHAQNISFCSPDSAQQASSPHEAAWTLICVQVRPARCGHCLAVSSPHASADMAKSASAKPAWESLSSAHTQGLLGTQASSRRVSTAHESMPRTCHSHRPLSSGTPGWLHPFRST